MSASITNDKIRAVKNGGAPAPTTASSARSIGGTSLSCVALTDWVTDTAVDFITYQKKSDGTMDKTTLCVWKGIVSSNTIGSLTLESGTDAGNAVGDFVEAAPTSEWGQGIYDGITAEHKTTGKHSDVTADSVTINSGGSIDMSNATTVTYKSGSVDTSTLAESVGNFGSWLSYPPSWTAFTTNPALGNGTITGKYVQVGKMVSGYVQLKFGSTTTFGSGEWYFSLPSSVNGYNSLTFSPVVGSAQGLRSSVAYRTGTVRVNIANNKVSIYRDGDGTAWSSSAPVTWGTADNISFNFCYETT